MFRIAPKIVQQFANSSSLASFASAGRTAGMAPYTTASRVLQIDTSATDGIISGKMMRRLRKKQQQEAAAKDPNAPKEEKVTLKQLREKCRSLGLTDYGTKSVLVKRIEEKTGHIAQPSGESATATAG